MASIGAMKIILLLVGILFFMVAFNTQGPGSSPDLNQTYSNFSQNTKTLSTSITNANSSGGVFGSIYNTFIIAQATYNVLIEMFQVLPTTITNLINIPVVGGLIAIIVLFIVAISAISWLYGRASNP